MLKQLANKVTKWINSLALNLVWKVDIVLTTFYHYCSSINYNYLTSIYIHWLRKSTKEE